MIKVDSTHSGEDKDANDVINFNLKECFISLTRNHNLEGIDFFESPFEIETIHCPDSAVINGKDRPNTITTKQIQSKLSCRFELHEAFIKDLHLK